MTPKRLAEKMSADTRFGPIRSAITAALREHQRFVVMSHVRPDGDAIGCTAALGLALKALGKEVTLWNQDGPLEKLGFLPGSDQITLPPVGEKRDFDVAIAIDTAVYERVGSDCLAALGNVGLWINIDHHVSNNGYGDLALIDPDAPAAGQILYELLESAGLSITPEIAENLFVAISTDTGSFQYSNTTARTLEIAAALVRAGVDIGEISKRLYHAQPLRRLELLKALLNVLKLSADQRIASFALSLETAQQLGVTPEDNEGMIDHLRAIDSVDIAIFLEELENGTVRISMRSKNPKYDVCKLCALFDGGGHTLASGARVKGSLAEIEARVLEAAERSLQ